MDISINNASETPIYQQLYDQLRRQIMQGELPAGAMLPSIRLIARELRISIITVKKAWEELEHAGLIVTQAGRGCFVAELSTQELDQKKDRLLLDRLTVDLNFYRSYGLSCEQLVQLIKENY